jgi:hypothetical protein
MRPRCAPDDEAAHAERRRRGREPLPTLPVHPQPGDNPSPSAADWRRLARPSPKPRPSPQGVAAGVPGPGHWARGAGLRQGSRCSGRGCRVEGARQHDQEAPDAARQGRRTAGPVHVTPANSAKALATGREARHRHRRDHRDPPPHLAAKPALRRRPRLRPAPGPGNPASTGGDRARGLGGRRWPSRSSPRPKRPLRRGPAAARAVLAPPHTPILAEALAVPRTAGKWVSAPTPDPAGSPPGHRRPGGRLNHHPYPTEALAAVRAPGRATPSRASRSWASRSRCRRWSRRIGRGRCR